jgi:hypothetical protein
MCGTWMQSAKGSRFVKSSSSEENHLRNYVKFVSPLLAAIAAKSPSGPTCQVRPC